MTFHNTTLTSSEIGSIWTIYMNDSASVCILGYMLELIEDPDIHSVIEEALNYSRNHIEKLTEFFQEEHAAIPRGFTEEDVNPNAPRLYTDTFCLTYLNHVSKVGMLAYSGFISMSARTDLVAYLSHALIESNKLYKETTRLMLEKGIFIRSPYISVPSERDYIDNKSYLSGFHFFSEQRPLNAIEISHLFMNIQTNLMGMKMSISFAQTSQLKEVQQFMLRGKEIALKHIKIFSSTLLDNDLQSPISSDVCITESTTPPFSDKLMMFIFSELCASGIGNYATAAAASQRSDLVLNYERLSLEVSKYAKSGADIMIEHGWLEQPPGTNDKNKLAKQKKS